MNVSRREFVALGAALGAGMMLPSALAEQAFAFTLGNQANPANPLRLTKWVARAPIPGFMPQARKNYYRVGAYAFKSRVHPQMRPTRVWGYRPLGFKPGAVPEPTWLGPTFAIARGTKTKVEWVNNLWGVKHPLPVDPSIMWADPFGDSPPEDFVYPVNAENESTYNYTLEAVPIITHVHGAETPGSSDGAREGWFTPGFKRVGPQFSQMGDVGTGGTGKHNIYPYYNDQLPATIWYHDHALGLDRLNVYMGLAGAYVIYDLALEPKGLPTVLDGTRDRFGQPYDIPLVIQDRIFDTEGQLWYPAESNNPTVNPFWVPEFFGDTITVNGKAWPFVPVEPRKYRFRILNGSNARFYNLRLWDSKNHRPGPVMRVVASDGGYLTNPAVVDSSKGESLLIAPGERYEVVIDFRGYKGGQLKLINDAKAPAPDGDPSNYSTVGQIVKFKVDGAAVTDRSRVPIALNPRLTSFPSLAEGPSVTRALTLGEVEGPGGPLAAVINYSRFMDPATEKPELGATEVWEIINTTMDAHPIHTHLVQMQVLSRQTYDQDAYMAALATAYGGSIPDEPMGPPLPYEQPGTERPDGSTLVGGNPDVTPFLTGEPKPANEVERGWKDTVKMFPGEVTRVKIRFAPNSGVEAFPFDATAEPGYVWHCHILEHEENDMMRGMQVVPPSD